MHPSRRSTARWMSEPRIGPSAVVRTLMMARLTAPFRRRSPARVAPFGVDDRLGAWAPSTQSRPDDGFESCPTKCIFRGRKSSNSNLPSRPGSGVERGSERSRVARRELDRAHSPTCFAPDATASRHSRKTVDLVLSGYVVVGWRGTRLRPKGALSPAWACRRSCRRACGDAIRGVVAVPWGWLSLRGRESTDRFHSDCDTRSFRKAPLSRADDLKTRTSGDHTIGQALQGTLLGEGSPAQRGFPAFSSVSSPHVLVAVQNRLT